MNEREFAEVAEAYARRLYAVAFRMLGNRADAEDAVQRALLKCYAARASYSPRWAMSTWLYRALTNVCIDELRRRRTRHDAERSDRPPDDERPARAHAGGERVGEPPGADRIDLTRALGTVPREARMLLALHYVDGLDYRELARIRGISVNTVKSQLARGKSILKQALQAGGHDGSH
jgi:RNA polymerase sigma-70 factor (ECF subfamily)